MSKRPVKARMDDVPPIPELDATYGATEMQAAIHRFKLEVLGHSDTTLHTADIVRQHGPFAVLVDPGRRRAFRDGLKALMRRLDYTVIACAIRKDAHLAAYGAAARDPYTLCLNVLVERFCFALADTQETQPGWSLPTWSSPPSAASWPASSRERTGRSWSPSCGSGTATM